jgi:ketosteroid isomerase-like protein
MSAEKQGEVKLGEAKLIGGNEIDRKRVMEQFHAYLEANSKFDWTRLSQEIWSADPDAVFFNLNGHTYNGRDHWVRLWQYYKQHMSTGEWIPYDIGGVVGADVATIWCHRHTKIRWTGTDQRPKERHEDADFVSRSTMTFHKEGGEWRVVHVHFSPASTDARPGGI